MEYMEAIREKIQEACDLEVSKIPESMDPLKRKKKVSRIIRAGTEAYNTLSKYEVSNIDEEPSPIEFTLIKQIKGVPCNMDAEFIYFPYYFVSIKDPLTRIETGANFFRKRVIRGVKLEERSTEIIKPASIEHLYRDSNGIITASKKRIFYHKNIPHSYSLKHAGRYCRVKITNYHKDNIRYYVIPANSEIIDVFSILNDLYALDSDAEITHLATGKKVDFPFLIFDTIAYNDKIIVIDEYERECTLYKVQ